AIVVDEHGSTVGLITREDLAEELLGEAAPAHRRRETTQPASDDGSHLVAGDALVRELNRDLELRLPESDEWTTVGGLCIARIGRIPRRGDVVALEHVGTLEIVDASHRRVRLVRITPLPPEPL
ncbi:MAG TPA: transporter associated domain-containing protein, partial [Myxococcota bacterium]